MAGERIEGMSIGLDLDSAALERGLTGLRDKLKIVNSEMRANLSAFDRADESIEKYETRLNGLNRKLEVQKAIVKQARSEYEKMVQEHGEGSKEADNAIKAYNNEVASLNNLERYIKRTEDSLSQLREEQNKTGSGWAKLKDQISSSMGGIGESLTKTLTVPLAALGAFSSTISAQFSNLTGDIAAKTGSTMAEASQQGEIVGKIWADGFGDSLQEVDDAIISVQQNLQNIKPSQLEDVTKKALGLAKITGADLDESLRGVNSLMTNFGMSADDAFDYLVTGAQRGLNKSHELEDNIAEYGQLWAQNGFSAKEMFSILENGLKTGAYNFDKVNDFVKEFGISLSDGRFEKNIGSFSSGTQELFNKFKAGKATTKDVFNSAINDLKGMKNQQDKLTIASTVWSALGEDNAMKVIESLNNTNHAYDKVKGAADKANKAMTSSPAAKLQSAWRGLQKELKPVGDDLMNLAASILPKVGSSISAIMAPFAKMSPTMQAVILGILGFIAALGPMLIAAGSAVSAIGNMMGALVNLQKAMGATSIMGGILSGVMAVLTSPITITIAAIAALAAVFVIAYNKSKPFHDFINGIGASLMKAFGFVKQFTTGIMQMFQGNWAGGADILSKIGLSDSAVQKTINIVTAIQNAFNILKGYLQQALSAVGSFVMSKITELKIFWDANGASIIQATKNIFSFLAVIIKAALAILTPIFKIGFGVFVTIIKSVWGNIKGIISGSLQVIEGIIQVFSGLFTGNWKKMWQGIKNIFSGAFKVLINWIQLNFIGKMLRVARGFVGPFKSIFSGLWGAMKSIFSAPIKWIGNIVKNGFNGMKNKAIGIFSSMKNGASRIWGSMVSTIKGLPGRMANGLKNGAGKLKSAMTSVGNAMLKGLGKGVNGVRNGINWILEKVHAPKKLRIPKWNVPQYAKGTDNHPGGFALLSDGKGKHKQELVTLPTGESFLSPVRETIMNLPKGTSVLNANATNQLLSIMPKYANGTGWLEKAWDVTKSAASKAVSGAKNVGKSILGGVKTVWDYATHPSKLISKAVSAFTNLSGLAQPTLGMVSGAVSMAKKGAKNWIKSLMDGGDNPGGSGVERWRPYVIRALEMNGLSTSKNMVAKVLRQIKTESGGNPKAVQHGYTDINTITGDLAKGLMQTISATFNAYKFKGHGNIFNGFDNLLAALNYAKHRHGKNLNGLGEGHGYKTGGLINTPGLYSLVEDGWPEIVIPTNPSRRTEAMKLLALAGRRINATGSNRRPSQLPDVAGESSGVINRLDKQIAMMQQQIDLLTKILLKSNVLRIDADALEKSVSSRQAKNYNNAAYMMG
ncbi:phage tail tape measure protein [Heyndrickxia faecalis]|uniref:phage tail tape measure protein n=1 Tax=Heyndrickxia faecalis TaxID=2824910 RepID=UPI003D219726